jgi:predicted nucleic acid-binding protein
VIAVDTNVIAYLLLGGGPVHAAERVLARDPDWASPPLWRHEFTNVLALHVRAGRATAADAPFLLDRAMALIRVEPEPDPRAVLELALASGRSAYDCAFIAAAIELDIPLVTHDAQLRCSFPAVTTGLE